MEVKWLREALSDDKGLGDMAYAAIGVLVLSAVGAVVYVCAMSTVDYAHCINTPITTVAKGEQSVTSVVPCRYDPLPTGQAVGLIFGGFATLIGALAGYMAATKRKET